MDNLNSNHHGLHAEHGLSFWIQSGHSNLLFDFGTNKKTFQNAKMLSIDLSQMNFCVCSHSHYDHSGGFPDLLDLVKVKTLITGPRFFEPKYSFDGTKYTYLGAGFDFKFLQQQAVSHQICEAVCKLADGCYAIGGFQKTYPMETIPQYFVRQTEQGFVRDDFGDEICLALETEKGLVVVAGCSHPGILNILETVTQKLNQPIYAVVGGTHLVEADEGRIRYTVSEMKRMGLKLLALSHCSGELAEQVVRADSDVMGCHLAVGESIVL